MKPSSWSSRLLSNCDRSPPQKHGLSVKLTARQLPRQASLHSVYQHWCCTEVAAIFDLPDKKLGEIGTRYESVSPLRGFTQHLVATRAPSRCQDTGSNDRPVQSTALNQLLLPCLVVISVAKNDLKRDSLQAADARLAIAGPKPSHANQSLDRLVRHRPQQYARRLGEQVNWSRQLSKPDTQGHDHSIDPGEGGPHIRRV